MQEMKKIAITEFANHDGWEEAVRNHYDGIRLTGTWEMLPEKVQEWKEQGFEVLFHSGLGIALSDTVPLEKQLEFAKRAGINDFSLALGFSCSAVEKTKIGYGYNEPAPGAELYSTKKFLNQAFRNAALIRRHLPEAHIAVENLDYWATGAYECCRADQVAEAAEALSESFGIKLLLDIGHAEVSAFKFALKRDWFIEISPYLMELETEHYLEALPLELITWAHLHRADFCAPEKGGIFDAHNSPSAFEVQLLDQVPNLKFVTFECPHNVGGWMRRHSENFDLWQKSLKIK